MVLNMRVLAILSILCHGFASTVFVQEPGDFFRPKPEQAGSWVSMSRGKIWPKPKVSVSQNTFLVLHTKNFKIKLNYEAQNCDILMKSLGRFESRIFPGDIPRSKRKHKNRQGKNLCTEETNDDNCDTSFRGYLEEITVHLESADDCTKFPYQNMDESYRIFVDQPNYEKKGLISAKTIWGLLRGMESFTHLIYNAEEHGFQYQINTTYIHDAPRFTYRGILIDTSRHFIAKKVMILNLDLMEINKFNVLHWHITDNPSFPYQSKKFPNLSEYGAFDPETHVYTQTDVANIIEAARIRGIRVIPEFDMPGHMKSWESGQPGLLTPCEDEQGNPTGIYGPIDPIKESTYSFLREFYDEITEVFPDTYLHIGGDEVSEDSCWRKNSMIRQAKRDLNLTTDNDLESMFIEKLLSILADLPIPNENIVWQEVFDNGDQIRPKTVIHIWKDWGIGWRNEANLITKSGYQAILSAPWYLNYPKYGSDWVNFYNPDPLAFPGTAEQKKLMIGGEVCLWGEFVNSVNLLPRLWPRASAAGEKLWSHFPMEADVTNKEVLDEAASRLQEHECRMLSRGFPVQPVVGAGYCPVHWEV